MFSTQKSKNNIKQQIWLSLSYLTALKLQQLLAALRYAEHDLIAAWKCLQDRSFQKQWRICDLFYQQLKDLPHQAIEKALLWAERPGNYIITWDHKRFPRYLTQINSPPLLLYLKGNVAALQQPQVAIVGSRKPTIMAKDLALQFSYELVAHGFTVTSGLAIGIDSCAHHGALINKSTQLLESRQIIRTIAVLGSGLENLYPASNKLLAEKIVSNNGAIISEFPLDAAPKRFHFPRRNRIVTGLCLGTVVVEASAKSGSLISARYTLEQNRTLMVVPSFPGNPKSEGGLQLLKDGASIVSCAQDVINLLPTCSWPSWLKPSKYIAAERNASEIDKDKPTGCDDNYFTGKYSLDRQSRHLLSCFDEGDCPAELLMSRSDLTPPQFHISLQLLQQAGYICYTASGYVRLKRS